MDNRFHFFDQPNLKFDFFSNVKGEKELEEFSTHLNAASEEISNQDEKASEILKAFQSVNKDFQEIAAGSVNIVKYNAIQEKIRIIECKIQTVPGKWDKIDHEMKVIVKQLGLVGDNTASSSIFKQKIQENIKALHSESPHLNPLLSKYEALISLIESKGTKKFGFFSDRQEEELETIDDLRNTIGDIIEYINNPDFPPVDSKILDKLVVINNRCANLIKNRSIDFQVSLNYVTKKLEDPLFRVENDVRALTDPSLEEVKKEYLAVLNSLKAETSIDLEPLVEKLIGCVDVWPKHASILDQINTKIAEHLSINQKSFFEVKNALSQIQAAKNEAVIVEICNNYRDLAQIKEDEIKQKQIDFEELKDNFRNEDLSCGNKEKTKQKIVKHLDKCKEDAEKGVSLLQELIAGKIHPNDVETVMKEIKERKANLKERLAISAELGTILSMNNLKKQSLFEYAQKVRQNKSVMDEARDFFKESEDWKSIKQKLDPNEEEKIFDSTFSAWMEQFSSILEGLSYQEALDHVAAIPERKRTLDQQLLYLHREDVLFIEGKSHEEMGVRLEIMRLAPYERALDDLDVDKLPKNMRDQSLKLAKFCADECGKMTHIPLEDNEYFINRKKDLENMLSEMERYYNNQKSVLNIAGDQLLKIKLDQEIRDIRLKVKETVGAINYAVEGYKTDDVVPAALYQIFANRYNLRLSMEQSNKQAILYQEKLNQLKILENETKTNFFAQFGIRERANKLYEELQQIGNLPHKASETKEVYGRIIEKCNQIHKKNIAKLKKYQDQLEVFKQDYQLSLHRTQHVREVTKGDKTALENLEKKIEDIQQKAHTAYKDMKNSPAYRDMPKELQDEARNLKKQILDYKI